MATETLQAAVSSILMMVLTLVLPAILAVGAKYLNDFIKARAQSSRSEYLRTMFGHIGDTIESVVNHTTQTYVRELKESDSFNLEEQKRAFNLTKNAALSMLNDEAKTLIETTHGDLNSWVNAQIESVIAEQALSFVLPVASEEQ
jgi:hypothetical protein